MDDERVDERLTEIDAEIKRLHRKQTEIVQAREAFKQILENVPAADDMDLTEVRRLCIEHLMAIRDGARSDHDVHDIYRAAIEALFGKEVWGIMAPLR